MSQYQTGPFCLIYVGSFVAVSVDPGLMRLQIRAVCMQRLHSFNVQPLGTFFFPKIDAVRLTLKEQVLMGALITFLISIEITLYISS